MRQALSLAASGVDAVQSGDAPAELLAALQNPQPASRSSWSLWAAQLRAAPSPAPPQPGTLGHTGQPETVQGPANQSAQWPGVQAATSSQQYTTLCSS